jgi:hypothetical protein
VSRWLVRTLVIAGAMIALPVLAHADTQGAGGPPPKNAPVDKKGGTPPSEEPAKPKPAGPVDKAPAEKAPAEKTPPKNKPVDKPAGSGAPTPPLQKKSPARHA